MKFTTAFEHECIAKYLLLGADRKQDVSGAVFICLQGIPLTTMNQVEALRLFLVNKWLLFLPLGVIKAIRKASTTTTGRRTQENPPF